MALNDPLANALSLVMNAEKIGRKEIIIKPISNTIKRVFSIMKDNGYSGDFREINDQRGNYIKISLLGKINKTGVIKPRFAVKTGNFEKFEKRYLLAKGFGIMIVTTSKGIMTHKEAKKKGIGGRLIAYCY
jgi:small subunit ribosomal protein S8